MRRERKAEKMTRMRDRKTKEIEEGQKRNRQTNIKGERERESERETERQRERDRERQRQRQRQRQRKGEREGKIERDRERKTDRQRQSVKELRRKRQDGACTNTQGKKMAHRVISDSPQKKKKSLGRGHYKHMETKLPKRCCLALWTRGIKLTLLWMLHHTEPLVSACKYSHRPVRVWLTVWGLALVWGRGRFWAGGGGGGEADFGRGVGEGEGNYLSNASGRDLHIARSFNGYLTRKRFFFFQKRKRNDGEYSNGCVK